MHRPAWRLNTRAGRVHPGLRVRDPLAGESNHQLLAHACLVAKTRTQPAFSWHDLGLFPGLVPGGNHAVSGEVYEIDEVTLAVLDRLESHPRF